MMKKYLSIWAVLLIFPYANSCYAQIADSTQVITSLTKCWRAFSHEYSIIYGLEEAEINRFSKQRVCFTRDSVSMFNGVVYTPKYAIRKVNAENYAKENFDCGKKKLNIYADSVYEITMSTISKSSKKGTLHKMTDVLLLDGECIYIVSDGVIFKMIDADSKVRPSTAN